jgi:hypothetical protein
MPRPKIDPDQDTAHIHIRIPKSVKEGLKAVAESQGKDQSKYLRDLIENGYTYQQACVALIYLFDNLVKNVTRKRFRALLDEIDLTAIDRVMELLK